MVKISCDAQPQPKKLGADLVDSMFFFHGSKGSVPQGSWQS